MTEQTFFEKNLLAKAIDLHRTGDLDGATLHYNKILSAQPSNHQALRGLGIIAITKHDYPLASTLLARADATAMASADVYYHIGEIYFENGRLNEANSYYQKTLAIDGRYETALFKHAVCLAKQHQLAKAESCYKTLLTLNPHSIAGLNNLGTVLLSQGKYQEALDCYDTILATSPSQVDALVNKGLILWRSAKPEPAKKLFEQALTHQPNQIEALFNLAQIHQFQKQYAKAIDGYQTILSLNPHFSKARTALLHVVRSSCQWHHINQLEASVAQLTESELAQNKVPSERPYENIMRTNNQALNLRVAKINSLAIEQTLISNQATFSFNNRGTSDQLITIGYLSGDFRDHALGHLTHSMFALHDRSQFKINTYAYGEDDNSHYRQIIKENSDIFRDLSTLHFASAAKQIYDDQVDILIDMSGYTGKHRVEICAMRPAPIQASYLGFIGSMGANFIDYIIADRIVIPPQNQQHYSEKTVYLPGCYQMTSYHQPLTSNRFSRASCHLPEDSFVFASFNQPFKLDPGLFDCWLDILDIVPNSVLWLFKDNEAAIHNLQHTAQQKGINPSRLIFANGLPRDDYLSRLQLADLMLDTRLYNGGTITSDALWAGVPVLTLMGNHFASKMASSILTNIGLETLITHSLNEYRKKAVEFATNPDLINKTKNTLKHNQPAFFNTAKQVKHLENAYHKMWQQYTNHKPPAPIICD